MNRVQYDQRHLLGQMTVRQEAYCRRGAAVYRRFHRRTLILFSVKSVVRRGSGMVVIERRLKVDQRRS